MADSAPSGSTSFSSATGSPEALAGVAKGDSELALVDIALAQRNGIKAPRAKFHKTSAAVREPILSASRVDALAGFSYLSAVNLRDRGVPAADLVVLRYAWSARSTGSRRTSNSASDRPRAKSSTTGSCRRSRLIN